MEQHNLGFFAKLIASIKDFEMYPVLAKLSTGKAVVYLLLLSLLVTAVAFIPSAYHTYRFYRETTQGLENLPDFKLENGRLNFAGSMPYYFVNDPNVDVEIIIDTTGETTEQSLSRYEAAILFTETFVVIKNNDGRTTRTEYQFLPSFSRNSLIKLIPWFLVIFFPVFFLFSLVWMFLRKLINALVVSLIAMIINSSLNARIKWEDLFKISIYAITLPTIISRLVGLLNLRVPGIGFMMFVMYYALVVYWLYRAIQATNNQITDPEIPETF
jgi:hypothetical protein